LDERVKKLEAKAKPGPQPQGVFAATILPSLMTYLAASTTDKNTTFPLSDAAIAISVASRIRTCEPVPNVYYPRVFMPDPSGSPNSTEIMDTLKELFRIQRQVSAGIKLQLPPSDPSKQGDASKPPTIVDAAGLDYITLSGATGLLDQILSSYTQSQASTGLPGIVAVIQGFQLQQMLVQANTYIVFLEGTAAGGTQRDWKNLFTTIIWGDIIRYSGGAVITFALVDTHSGLKAAKTFRYITTHTSLKKPSCNDAVRFGDNLSVSATPPKGCSK
jgi:hypothetical protein